MIGSKQRIKQIGESLQKSDGVTRSPLIKTMPDAFKVSTYCIQKFRLSKWDPCIIFCDIFQQKKQKQRQRRKQNRKRRGKKMCCRKGVEKKLVPYSHTFLRKA